MSSKLAEEFDDHHVPVDEQVDARTGSRSAYSGDDDEEYEEREDMEETESMESDNEDQETQERRDACCPPWKAGDRTKLRCQVLLVQWSFLCLFAVSVLVFAFQVPAILLAIYTPNPGSYQTNFKEERRTQIGILLIVIGSLSLIIVGLGMATIKYKDKKITGFMVFLILIELTLFSFVIQGLTIDSRSST